MKNSLMWVVGIIIVIAIALGAHWHYTQTQQAGVTPTDTTASADAANQQAENRDASNQALESDMTDLNTQMSALDTDTTATQDTSASAQ